MLDTNLPTPTTNSSGISKPIHFTSTFCSLRDGLSNNVQIAEGFLPKLTIEGAGVDLESVTSTDLVASLMNIVAPIYGGDNDVSLGTGDLKFNYLDKSITILSNLPETNNFSEVPLGFQKNELGNYTLGFPSINISVDGVTIPMLFDTGASAWPSNEALEHNH